MTKNPKILVVDDDAAHRTMLNAVMEAWGYAIIEADDGETAIDAVKKSPFDLILMDIRMVRMSGIEALEKIKKINPSIPIIIMTAFSSVETAVDALKKGAYDYLIKPLDFEKMKLTIERAMEHLRLKKENRMLKKSLGSRFNRDDIIGQGPAMTRLLDTVAQVAVSEATIMITGDSGTGKELIAGAVHFNSPRKKGPFVKINCAALTETLLESELFGHEKGAFTGADNRKEGRFVQADKGSLFLDEVSEMSVAMQVKLLRVLQERELTRVGGEGVIPVDVRVIVATNKDLGAMVKNGTFREDLYYRLNVVELQMPPLKERLQDIPLLANHFLGVFARKNKKQLKGFTPGAMDLLQRYSWPGNVRELMNCIERAVVLSLTSLITEDDFAPPVNTAKATEESTAEKDRIGGDGSLEEIQKHAIIRTLNAAGGNKSEAARRLKITRKTLREKLKKYGVE